MSIYLYWGEDDYGMEIAVKKLRDRILDPMWISFNYTVFNHDTAEAPILALNQAMTPPFGAGGRLVWLANSNICQQSSDKLLAELERTLPVIPEASILLITTSNKPDDRLKSTKIIKKYAEVHEFSLIPPWKTELIVQQVNRVASEIGVKLTPRSVEMISESVGNDTRLLYNELEKIRLYANDSNQPQDLEVVAKLVRNATQNSLQLAGAIRSGNTAQALSLVADLIAAAEPGLRIVATLIGQFRTWLLVKVMVESGEKNPQEIAKFAEIGNPKRVYFLQKEVQTLTQSQLLAMLPILLDLEVNLKQGASELTTLQTKVIELCQVCQRKSA